MWVADIYCDFEWVARRQGVLGAANAVLRGPTSEALNGAAIEFHLFGDVTAVRHLRALMHTDDKEAVVRCLDGNSRHWVHAIEVAVMLQTGRHFEVAKFPGTETYAVSYGEGTVNSPALELRTYPSEPAPMNYKSVMIAFGAWNGALDEYLFYFRRFVDNGLPLDVRWLNGYKLVEWHFVRGQAKLARNATWRDFVVRFDDDLRTLARPGQTAAGLIEEARALAAHAGIDRRDALERARDPRNAMEKTLRVLERMVATVLNEHPERTGSPVRFGPRDEQPSTP